MEIQEIITAIMKEHKVTQKEMAAAMGYTAQGSVASALRGNSMRVDTAEKMLSSMGCRLVILDGEKEWVVGGEDEPTARVIPDKMGELEAKVEKIAEAVKALVLAQQGENGKGKKSSGGKIPLTQAGSVDGRYFDPSWFDPDNNSKK